MSSHIPEQRQSMFGPPERCPGCNAAGLTCTTAGDLVTFLCRACGSCWHIELGYVYRVSSEPAEPASR